MGWRARPAGGRIFWPVVYRARGASVGRRPPFTVVTCRLRSLVAAGGECGIPLDSGSGVYRPTGEVSGSAGGVMLAFAALLGGEGAPQAYRWLRIRPVLVRTALASPPVRFPAVVGRYGRRLPHVRPVQEVSCSRGSQVWEIEISTPCDVKARLVIPTPGRGRIMRELHDTVKQGVHGTSLMIRPLPGRGGAAMQRPSAFTQKKALKPLYEADSPSRGRTQAALRACGDPAAFSRRNCDVQETLAYGPDSPPRWSSPGRITWPSRRVGRPHGTPLSTRGTQPPAQTRESQLLVLALRDVGGFRPEADGGGYSPRSRATRRGPGFRSSSAPGMGR